MTAALDLEGADTLRPGTRVPAALGAAGRAMLEGTVVAISDYKAEPGKVPELETKGVLSALAAPVHEHGSVIGSLVVSSRTRPHAFGEVEQEMLTLFAEQASVALAAARTANSMRQAFHDSLTGLPNRALLLDRMELTLARAEREGRDVTVLFLDLDGFKPINDSLGHLAGDRLLIEVARRLKECLRRAETAARLGGDEFAILLADLDDPARATDVAERVIAALERPFTLLGREVFVSASIGIASGRAAPKISSATRTWRCPAPSVRGATATASSSRRCTRPSSTGSSSRPISAARSSATSSCSTSSRSSTSRQDAWKARRSCCAGITPREASWRRSTSCRSPKRPG